MTYKEIQKLSREYRTIASRLLHSNIQDALDNLKRFIRFIDNNDIIRSFIETNCSTTYDIEYHFNNRQDDGLFPAQLSVREEISFTYQLLKYAVEKIDEYYKLVLNYSYEKNIQSHVDGFSKIILLPFVQHISAHLEDLLDDLKETTLTEKQIISIENSPGVVFNQGGENHTSFTTTNYINDMEQITIMIDSILKSIQSSESIDHKNDELIELLEDLRDEINSGKPKKKFIKLLIEKINILKDIVYIGTILHEPINKLINYFGSFIK